MYGFCPLCSGRWRRKLPASENRRPQVSHLYGCSPVWVRSCSISLSFFVKLRPHASQTYIRTDWLSKLWLPIAAMVGSSNVDEPDSGQSLPFVKWSISNFFLAVTFREGRRTLLLRLTFTPDLRLDFLTEFWQEVLSLVLFKLLPSSFVLVEVSLWITASVQAFTATARIKYHFEHVSITASPTFVYYHILSYTVTILHS